jgi:UDP-glucuronate decarboxylase
MNTNYFKHKNLLITGGSGFIGKNILDYILVNNIQFKTITIITRNINNFKLFYPNIGYFDNLNCIESDIKTLKIENKNFEIIIHAATSVVDQIPNIDLYNDIIIGTKNILELARKNNCQLFINFSSGAVYGQFDSRQAKVEYDNLLITNDLNKKTYTITKIAVEHLCYLYSSNQDFQVLNLRCFSFIGKYLNLKHYAIGEFIHLAKLNQDINIKSHNNVYRSYLHTDDLCNWLFKLIEYTLNHNIYYSTFNIGSNQPIEMTELAYLVKKLLNSSSKIISPNKNQDIMYYIPNIDLITSLGCKINKEITESIIELAQINNERISI